MNKLSKFCMRVSAGIKRRRIHNACQGTRKFANIAVASLFGLLAAHAFAQPEKDTRIKFVNVADSTQDLSGFGQFPAINNRGAVAFVANQTGSGQGVFKSERHDLRTIASTTNGPYTFFGDDVVINATGVVGFLAGLNTGGRATGIFTSDGLAVKTIVNTSDTSLGLTGPGLGSPSINASGTVAFMAPRIGFRSAVIFTGEGGALTPVLDTLNTEFRSFGNVAINASGDIVFRGILKDRNEGVFVATPNPDGIETDEKEKSEGAPAGPVSVIDIVDSHNPDFNQFGDPVINGTGTVADFAGVASGLEVLSGNSRGITPRNDPGNGLFIDIEHPSINNRGAVAFSVLEANGGQGIFVELTGGASPVAVLQTGDPLFGSMVTGVHVGRFAFNDHFRLAFEYELADGRSGIAVASLHTDDEDQEEK